MKHSKKNKHFFLILLLVISNIKMLSQSPDDCFFDIKLQIRITSHFPDLKVGDTINMDIIDSINSIRKRVIGCTFPNTTFKTTQSKTIELETILADYIILNFNYLFCNYCLGQLDEMVNVKEQYENKFQDKSLIIISLFETNKKENFHITKKYNQKIEIVSDAGEFVKDLGLDGGFPMTYILDKNRKILFVECGGDYNYLNFYSKLNEIIK
jgi:peroxiredoxin